MARQTMETLSCIGLRKGLLSAGIAPEWGAALTSLEIRLGSKRIDILRPARRPQPGVPPALAASCFPLIPYAGRLRGGRFDFDGRTIVYPLNALPEINSSHGDGFTRRWALTQLERHRAVMEILPDPGAPIQYHCARCVEVLDDRVRVGMRIRNLEERRIPLGIGLHPYFANRDGAVLAAELPVRWHWDSQLMPTTREPNSREPQYTRGVAAGQLPVAAQYEGWNGEARIEWPADGVTVRLVTRPALSHVVIWAPQGEDFFCFEPLSHATDSFNLRNSGFADMQPIVLEPGASYEQTFSFIVAHASSESGPVRDCSRDGGSTRSNPSR
jgi:aldose 1-epimerase